MARHIALLRGVNIGNRRMAMPRLREVLEAAGFTDVETYVQSGNVVLSSRKAPSTVARTISETIEAEWGFDVPVVLRTHEEFEAVIDHDPFGEVADDPARYSVLFFDAAPEGEPFDEIDRAAFAPEQFELHGRELYVWLPGGTARSPLMREFNRAKYRSIQVATMRNWRTINALADM